MDGTTKIEIVDEFAQQIDEHLESLAEIPSVSNRDVKKSPTVETVVVSSERDPLILENAEEDDFSASEALSDEDLPKDCTSIEDGFILTMANPRPRVQLHDSDDALSGGIWKEKSTQRIKRTGTRNSPQRTTKKKCPEITSSRGRGKGKGRGKGLSNRLKNFWSMGKATTPDLYSNEQIHKTYTDIFDQSNLRVFDGLPKQDGDLILDNFKCSRCKTRDFRCSKETCLKDESTYFISALECCQQNNECLCPKVFQLPENRYTEVMSLFDVSRVYGRHMERQMQQMCTHFKERTPDVPTVAARAAYLIGASIERQRQNVNLNTKREELASLDKRIAERRETLSRMTEQIEQYRTTDGST